MDSNKPNSGKRTISKSVINSVNQITKPLSQNMKQKGYLPIFSLEGILFLTTFLLFQKLKKYTLWAEVQKLFKKIILCYQ